MPSVWCRVGRRVLLHTQQIVKSAWYAQGVLSTGMLQQPVGNPTVYHRCADSLSMPVLFPSLPQREIKALNFAAQSAVKLDSRSDLPCQVARAAGACSATGSSARKGTVASCRGFALHKQQRRKCSQRQLYYVCRSLRTFSLYSSSSNLLKAYAQQGSKPQPLSGTPLPTTSDADVEASFIGAGEDQPLETGVIPESRLYAEDPVSNTGKASTSGRPACSVSAVSTDSLLLYPPSQRSQIRESWYICPPYP